MIRKAIPDNGGMSGFEDEVRVLSRLVHSQQIERHALPLLGVCIETPSEDAVPGKCPTSRNIAFELPITMLSNTVI